MKEMIIIDTKNKEIHPMGLRTNWKSFKFKLVSIFFPKLKLIFIPKEINWNLNYKINSESKVKENKEVKE